MVWNHCLILVWARWDLTWRWTTELSLLRGHAATVGELELHQLLLMLMNRQLRRRLTLTWAGVLSLHFLEHLLLPDLITLVDLRRWLRWCTTPFSEDTGALHLLLRPDDVCRHALSRTVAKPFLTLRIIPSSALLLSQAKAPLSFALCSSLWLTCGWWHAYWEALKAGGLLILKVPTIVIVHICYILLLI